MPVEESAGEANERDVSSQAAIAAHNARLDQTLEDLRERIQQQRESLEKLRQAAPSHSLNLTKPSYDPKIHLRQLRTIRAAYDRLTHSEFSNLPPPDTPLPALLALRTTHSLNRETKTAITETQEKFELALKRLEQEEQHGEDARRLAASLGNRIAQLQTQLEERSQKSPSQAAEELLSDIEKRRKAYHTETRRLVKAFNRFIDKHLAAMLAAEELGGPVAGDLLGVSDATLEAGFSHHGKAKKPVESSNEPKRQRRIDEIWGQGNGDERTERGAAGMEMRKLSEDLLNASALAVEGSGSEYVELDRESAAARFLVRAKIAQFHPRDSKRLRLIDFGRELED
ncbi:MAG: hypothetical protein M1825_001776 [Sarcosagium campestre]|nr:MAG: hypothetical protein M1825_001776 [Sarcosagium campestre]